MLNIEETNDMRAIYSVTRKMLKARNTSKEIVDALAFQFNVPEHYALQVIEETRTMRYHKRRGLVFIIWGSILAISGIAINYNSYAQAEPGQTYYIFWGAVGFSVVCIFQGISIYRR